MKTTLLIFAALAFIFSSCEKTKELLDPKSGDEKNEDLLKGTWKVDSTLYGSRDQSTVVAYDTVTLNDGTLEFGPRSKSAGSNYGVGYLYHNHMVNGASVTDTMNWYSGDWGSTSIEGVRITIFMGRLQDLSFDANTDVHFDFLQKDKSRVRIAGTRAYSVPSGAVVRYHYRFALSK